MALLELDAIQEFFFSPKDIKNDYIFTDISIDSVVTYHGRIMHKLRLFKNLDISRVRLITKILKMQNSSPLLNSISSRSLFLLSPLQVRKKELLSSEYTSKQSVSRKEDYKDLLKYAASRSEYDVPIDETSKTGNIKAAGPLSGSTLNPQRKNKRVKEEDDIATQLLGNGETNISEEDAWKLLFDEVNRSADMHCCLEEAAQYIFLSTLSQSSLDHTPFISIMKEVEEEVKSDSGIVPPPFPVATPSMSAVDKNLEEEEEALYHIYQSYWQGDVYGTEKELGDLRALHHSLLDQSAKACAPYSPFAFCSLK